MNKFIKNLLYLLHNRFVIFIIFIVVFIVIQLLAYKTILPSTDDKDLWFFSGIIMVLFSILFIEPYYSSPKNVVTNSIPLLLIFISIKSIFLNQFIWWSAVSILAFLLIASVVAISLEDKNKSSNHWKNKTALIIKRSVVFVGQGKVLYSAVFIFFLLTYYSIQNIYTLAMFIIWFFILSINPKNIHSNFSDNSIIKNHEQVGEVFSVQSKSLYLIKLFEDSPSINKFDVVKFSYSQQDSTDKIIIGIVFDICLLNKEKWIKVLQLDYINNNFGKLVKNIAYKVSSETEISRIGKRLKLSKFVGRVIEGSTIEVIKFEYSKLIDNIQELDILELNISGRRLFYQVIGGLTDFEKLEDKNETGFIEGDAVQLGEWHNDSLSFIKYGWLPSINTPIYKADTSDIEIPKYSYPFFKLGNIPGTTLPSVMNLHDAISHHTALLGITGSGKSFLANELVKQIQTDMKIICIDITGEWKTTLAEEKPIVLIDPAGISKVEELLANKETASKNKNSTGVLKYKKEILERLCSRIEEYSKSDNKIAIFELPDLSNTSFILELTQIFLESIFILAKQNTGNKFCIILEEAHTIIPETTFLGDLGDYSSNKGLVNKIGQIALQGRKYGVGFLIIAQRTAIVSKTVLTQCNTVICFQAFDETSFNFLGNYIGSNVAKTLPNLPKYHAIAAGKALLSNIPMIIDLTRR
jgi:hypothetical protein